MQQVILILSRLIATCRKQWLSNNSARFILGILIGILLGFCVTFETATQSILIKQPKQFTTINSNTSVLSDIQIQCIIFIHPNQLFKRKYVQTLRDTYTKQCNHTVYITNSEGIRRNFSEEINVAFVKTKKTQYHWDLYREIIKYSTKYNQQQSQFWTIISDEQTFIVMANLRRLLSAFNNSQQSFILGRISSK
ncbi:hypothetical protein WUBG_05633, partial [Wuchereria bancrofti]